MLWFSWKPVLCVMTWITPIQSHFHNVDESEAPKGASQDPLDPLGPAKTQQGHLVGRSSRNRGGAGALVVLSLPWPAMRKQRGAELSSGHCRTRGDQRHLLNYSVPFHFFSGP